MSTRTPKKLTPAYKRGLLLVYGFKRIQETFPLFRTKKAEEAYRLLEQEWFDLHDFLNEKERKAAALVKQAAVEAKRQAAKVKKERVEAKRASKKQATDYLKRYHAYIESDLPMRSKLARTHPTFHLTDFEERNGHKSYRFLNYIHYWLRTQNKEDKPFKLRLDSMSASVGHTFSFNAKDHFDAWFEKVIVQVRYEGDGYGTDTKRTEAARLNKNVIPTSFEEEALLEGWVEVTMLAVTKGGCTNRNKTNQKTIKTTFYTFEVTDPYSKDSNCFFACLRWKYQGLNVDTRTLRSQFKIPSGQPVCIEKALEIMRHLEITELSILETEESPEEPLEDGAQLLLLHNSHF
jgi:hypothetical protein